MLAIVDGAAGFSLGFLTASANSSARTITASAPPTSMSFLGSSNSAAKLYCEKENAAGEPVSAGWLLNGKVPVEMPAPPPARAPESSSKKSGSPSAPK